MKNAKKILLLSIGGTLTLVAGMFAYSRLAKIQLIESIIFGAIGLVAAFSIILAFNRFKDEKKGLTTEDELSRNIKEKASASSFTSSFYLWTMILLFTTDSGINGEVLLGIGIAGMTLLYVGFWLYFNKKGIDNENSH